MKAIVSLEEEILQAIKKGGDGGADLQLIQDQCGLGSPAQVVSCLKQMCAAGNVVKHGARHYLLAKKHEEQAQHNDDGLVFSNRVSGQIIDGADKECDVVVHAPAVQVEAVEHELDALARKLEFESGVKRIALKKNVLERLSNILAGDIAEVLYEIRSDLERLHG